MGLSRMEAASNHRKRSNAAFLNFLINRKKKREKWESLKCWSQAGRKSFSSLFEEEKKKRQKSFYFRVKRKKHRFYDFLLREGSLCTCLNESGDEKRGGSITDQQHFPHLSLSLPLLQSFSPVQICSSLSPEHIILLLPRFVPCPGPRELFLFLTFIIYFLNSLPLVFLCLIVSYT